MAKKFCLAFFVFTALLCVLFEVPVATAQDSRFRGTVKDEEGNPIPKAKLTLTLKTRNLSFDFESNDKGKFYRRGIEPGDFLLNVEAEGFEPFQQEVYFSVGEQYTLDIVLVKKQSQEEAKNQFLLGVKLYQEGQYDLAIENFEAVLKDNPDFAEGYYNIGMAYLKKGDLDGAMTQMARAIELKPDFIQAYFGLGQVYIEKGQKDKATEIFQQAIDIAPNEARTYVNLGIFYFTINEDDLALEALLKAKDIDPSLAQIYYQLGLVYTRKGELDKTLESFEKFLELAPQAPEAATVKTLLEELKKK
jgi:tetratricopeptide (TPR) repeat protein